MNSTLPRPNFIWRLARMAVVALAPAVIFVAACAPPPAPPTVAPPAPLTKVRLVILPFLSSAPLLIALDQGFFGDEGLEVELVQLESSSTALPSLAQGDVDLVSAVTGASTLSAIARGAQIRMVADRTSWAADGCDYHGLLVRPDLLAGNEIARPEQLAGLHLNTNPVGAEGFYVDRILQAYGLTLDDMEIADLPVATLIDALNNGSMDMVDITEPWLTRIVESGAGVLWKGAREVVPDFQFAVLLYGPNLLEKDRETGERVIRAYLRGVRQYNEGKTERNLDIISRATEIDPALLKTMCWPTVRNDGRINTDSIMDFQVWAVGKGYLDASVPVQEFWDGSFAEKAASDLQP